MVNLKIPIYAAAILLLPNALSARAHGHAHAANPLAAGAAKGSVKGLAKATAVSANLANAFTRQDLVGFWLSRVVDSSETPFRYYDSAEVYFGNSGDFELRSKATEVNGTNGENWSYSTHEIGSWVLTDSSLIMDGHHCLYAESDSIPSQDNCIITDTLPTEEWEIKTAGGSKIWSLPEDPQLNGQQDTPFFYYTYTSADPHFTLPNLLTASLAPGKPHGQLRQGKSFSFYPGNRALSPQALLDLRGKSIVPGRQGQGFYYPSGNVP
jgi:hypothetical protein